jgi:hypothetical protein
VRCHTSALPLTGLLINLQRNFGLGNRRVARPKALPDGKSASLQTRERVLRARSVRPDCSKTNRSCPLHTDTCLPPTSAAPGLDPEPRGSTFDPRNEDLTKTWPADDKNCHETRNSCFVLVPAFPVFKALFKRTAYTASN